MANRSPRAYTKGSAPHRYGGHRRLLKRAKINDLDLMLKVLVGVSVHLRPSGYGGQPSRGLPTVARADVGKRERRLVDLTGIEPVTS